MSHDKLAAWAKFDDRMKRKAHLSGDPENMAQAAAIMSDLLGRLKGLYWAHWTAHWQSKGRPSYGDHLMFERMKDLTSEEIDVIAEKAVGYFGPKTVSVEAVMVGEHAGMQTASGAADGGPVDELARKMLAMEQAFQAHLKMVYDQMKELEALPMGLDDYLMALSGAHDTNVFLLQQRLLEAGGEVGGARVK